MPTYARRVAPFGTTIFAEINALAQQHQAVNLGQGKPDFDGPASVIEEAVSAMLDGRANQYAAGYGLPLLRERIAAHVAARYGLAVDADTGVLVTNGASEGVYAAILGTVNEGDEVILLEPFFDTYLPAVLNAGGIPRYVPMRPPHWTFDTDELRQAFNARTGAIVLNTPHNPTGRVFNAQELAFIAELCQQHDVIVISDEVYEHLTYDDHCHVPIATLPNMFERTLTVSSAAKTFSLTGWKIGWVYGNPELVTGAWRIHQNIVYAVNHPAQYGIAHALTLGQDYYDELARLYDSKRRLLVDILQGSGFHVSVPQGAFYVMADFSALHDGDDLAFAKFLIEQVGVATIPPSSFFCPEHRHIGAKTVRFAFCKHDDVLHAAGDRLRKLAQRV